MVPVLVLFVSLVALVSLVSLVALVALILDGADASSIRTMFLIPMFLPMAYHMKEQGH